MSKDKITHEISEDLCLINKFLQYIWEIDKILKKISQQKQCQTRLKKIDETKLKKVFKLPNTAGRKQPDKIAQLLTNIALVKKKDNLKVELRTIGQIHGLNS